MNLEAFIREVRAGRVYYLRGVASRQDVAGVERVLDVTDLNAVTAEAYNQNVLDPELPWDQGLRQVREAITHGQG